MIFWGVASIHFCQYALQRSACAPAATSRRSSIQRTGTPGISLLRGIDTSTLSLRGQHMGGTSLEGLRNHDRRGSPRAWRLRARHKSGLYRVRGQDRAQAWQAGRSAGGHGGRPTQLPPVRWHVNRRTSTANSKLLRSRATCPLARENPARPTTSKILCGVVVLIRNVSTSTFMTSKT